MRERRPQRVYCTQEKIEAVRRTTEVGNGSASRELGIPSGTLSCWGFLARQAAKKGEVWPRTRVAEVAAELPVTSSLEVTPIPTSLEPVEAAASTWPPQSSSLKAVEASGSAAEPQPTSGDPPRRSAAGRVRADKTQGWDEKPRAKRSVAGHRSPVRSQAATDHPTRDQDPRSIRSSPVNTGRSPKQEGCRGQGQFVRIQEGDSPAFGTRERLEVVRQPVWPEGSGRAGPSVGRALFVPVQVVEARASSLEVHQGRGLAAEAPTLEVVLAGERRIRVPSGFDDATLYRLVQVLEAVDRC